MQNQSIRFLYLLYEIYTDVKINFILFLEHKVKLGSSSLFMMCIKTMHVNSHMDNLSPHFQTQVMPPSVQHSADIPGDPMSKTLCPQYRGPSSIPGQGTRSYMLQLRVLMLQLKIPCVLQLRSAEVK